MVDRILLVLKVKNLTASKFADEIGVQRSSISHILSGRNLPSLDLIQKVLKTYPELSSEWLLNGIGPMSKSSGVDLFNSQPKETVTPVIVQPGLFEVEENNNEVLTVDNEVFSIENDKRNGDLESNIGGNESGSSKISSSEEVKKEDSDLMIGNKTREKATEIVEPEQSVLKNDIISDKKIEKIVIFYNNKTFREYFPE
jgi:transcriptional regulator with XRE-family HTH domain